MDEKKLTGQLFRITAITIAGSVLLSFIAFGILLYIMKSSRDIEYEQLQTQTAGYRTRLLKQMDKNLQILTTLSKAYEVSTIADDPERLEKNIIATNSANDFVSMVYMSEDGTGVMHTAGYGVWDEITLQEFNLLSVQAIEKAFQGEKAISGLFDSEVFDGKLFVYAVPVYREGKITGVLSASDTQDVFENLTSGETVMNGTGHVDLINAEGEFLIRSGNTFVEEKLSSIYQGEILSGDVRMKIEEALEKGESVSGRFFYEDEECHFCLEPLGMNGWYLLCANRAGGGTSGVIGNILKVFGVIVVMIAILVNVLLYGEHHAFSKNTKSLIRAAYTDPLTGTDNTVRFDQNFGQMAGGKKPYSTVALNVHNFKGINDLFGKKRGNLVLCYLKKMIEENLNPGEFFCRDTADLFYLLLLDTEERIITERLRKVIDSVSAASLAFGEYSYDLSLYAGVAVKEDREKALIAMQSIRNTHHTDIAFYNHAMHEAARKKNRIESQMYPALQNKEFKLFLQPKFDMVTDAMIGAEALVRWEKPDGSYRMPDEFIPLFEENGFCLELDMYMMERVCEQIRDWINAGIDPVPISVNQSKLMFSDLKYPENLEKVLAEYHVPSSLITLEILEGIATGNTEFLNHQIDALHDRGFRISMDDFGSGYSSLNMLYQIKIDELKLDRGFLRKVSKEDEDRRQLILEQIVSFAKKLGIATVAEGIETREDKEFVKRLQYDFGQGYFYDQPMCADEFSRRYMRRTESRELPCGR